MDLSVQPLTLVLLTWLVSASVSGLACLRDGREKYENCSSCLMSAGPACGWCLQTYDKSLGLGACLTMGSPSCNLWYKKDDIEGVDEGEEWSDTDTDYIRSYTSSGKTLKTMQFKLRPNKERTIKIEAKKKNNPVDMKAGKCKIQNYCKSLTGDFYSRIEEDNS